jgi:hypothetical protein
MTQPPDATRDEALWRALVDREKAFYAARAAFMSGATDRVAVLRSALRSAAERGTALRVLPLLPVAERQALFDDLVRLASVGHADVQLVRDAILSLPRDWTLTRLEAAAEPLLQDGTDEEYRRLLELYVQIDPTLTRQLAARAVRHTDEHVREAGEDFLARLGA